MKISHKLLSTFFAEPLPRAEDIAEALTFHAWEIEEVIPFSDDTVLDVKVLPDKTPWALSHRGIAKDLSVILPNLSLVNDPFTAAPVLEPVSTKITVRLDSSVCDRYTAVHITGLTVGPSPAWLSDTLRVLGQRSINNVVDLTNYVMFLIGQPLHAFDARKLSGEHIGVRKAKAGEEIVTLTGETYTLTPEDTLIVDGVSDIPLGIGGVKGGKHAEIDATTTDIILESAHFDSVAIRKTSKRLSLRTDASIRFENGIVSDIAPIGAYVFTKLLREHASDFGNPEIQGFADTGAVARDQKVVAIQLSQINSVLGLTLTEQEVTDIFVRRFGFTCTFDDVSWWIKPPFERTDIVIAEDLIEEIGRMYGYEHVQSIAPKAEPVPEINKTFVYMNRIRHALKDAGYSEIYTSSFREKDQVKMKNPFASDKGYLRSLLSKNMDEALARNVGNTYLLGCNEIRAFEIGTVFTHAGEESHIVLGVRGPGGYKQKAHDPILEEGVKAVEQVLGTMLVWKREGGIAEAPLTGVFATLVPPTAYDSVESVPAVTFVPFSSYPSMVRDIAFFIPLGVTAMDAEEILNAAAGPLRVRTTLFDEFEKEGKKSLAFRLIFQSFDRTLTDEEVNVVMDGVYRAASEHHFEVR